jgi:hypothetical protein
MKELPRVRGIRGLTSAITRSAVSTPAGMMSTLTPRLMQPWSSGGDTWMRATSMRNRRLRMSSGISERKTGMKSARPSCTACRTLDPMKKAVCRKRLSRPGST